MLVAYLIFVFLFIQGCNTPSRKCTTYSWRIQPNFVQYSLQPTISFERGSNCAEHAINLSNMCLYFYIFTKVQYTIHCRKQGCFQDAWSSQKINLFNVQDTAVFSRSACLKFHLRFHAQNVLFRCKCVTFFQQGSAFKAKYHKISMMPGKGLDSIVVKLFTPLRVGWPPTPQVYFGPWEGLRVVFPRGGSSS